MAKTEDVRMMNLSKVNEVFIQEGICTKNMLAEKTGLSLGTCTNLLKKLLEDGKIKRIEDSASTGGRKAKQYQLIDNVDYFGVVFYHQKQLYLEKIDIRGQVLESEMVEDLSYLDSWLKQTFKKVVICGLTKDEQINADYYDRAVLVASYGYSQVNDISDLALIYQAPQQLSSCGLVLNGQMLQGKTNFAGEISFIPIENQVEQFKMLKSKKEATSLLSKQIASLVAIMNPKRVVVISDKISSLDKLTNKVAKWIDEKHMPEIVVEEDFTFWVMQGLRSLCLNHK